MLNFSIYEADRHKWVCGRAVVRRPATQTWNWKIRENEREDWRSRRGPNSAPAHNAIESSTVVLQAFEMERHMDRNGKSQAKLKDLVVVTYVEDLEQAREYETLLRLNDIPAVVKEQLDPTAANGSIAVMVPEDFLDEAHVVIESQDAYDDFYDFALEDEDDADFDTDVFDDEF